MTGRWGLEGGTQLVFCADGTGVLRALEGDAQSFRWRTLSDKALEVRWSDGEEIELLPFRMTDNGLHIRIGEHQEDAHPLRYLGKPDSIDAEVRRLRAP